MAAPSQGRAACIERRPDGETLGADPRAVPLSLLRAAGHDKQPLLRAIRAKCLDCCGGQQAEVRRCTAVGCALWPYRMASNPFDARTAAAADLRRKTADPSPAVASGEESGG